ncbi:hypothetical protein F5Y14DRAFT_52691 [Nemania sp. NC0429]|nr:hypothetical protein F5Y14DRAFT_52691 [Nemania sp. NC0429]
MQARMDALWPTRKSRRCRTRNRGSGCVSVRRKREERESNRVGRKFGGVTDGVVWYTGISAQSMRVQVKRCGEKRAGLVVDTAYRSGCRRLGTPTGLALRLRLIGDAGCGSLICSRALRDKRRPAVPPEGEYLLIEWGPASENEGKQGGEMAILGGPARKDRKDRVCTLRGSVERKASSIRGNNRVRRVGMEARL